MTSRAETVGGPRPQRVARYKSWTLQKQLADLSSQVEVAVLEARQLLAWKQEFQPLQVAELTAEDRQVIEASHKARMVDIVQKHCVGILKGLMQHRFAFPFNAPVDTTRFTDYLKVVESPIDFSTIKARAEAGQYRDPKDFMEDLYRVFTNAKKYNPVGTDCNVMAVSLEDVTKEKYEKQIAPKLAEEATTTAKEELVLRKRRAEQLNQQHMEALELQCSSLLSMISDLQFALVEAKSMAASMCEPLSLEEKQALAVTIQGLPTAQLEATVAFVASRHPPSVSNTDANGTTGRRVQLNLGKYDALLLRQLQHLVSACTAARATGAGAGAAPAGSMPPPYPSYLQHQQALQAQPGPLATQQQQQLDAAGAARQPADGSVAGPLAGSAQGVATSQQQEQEQQGPEGTAAGAAGTSGPLGVGATETQTPPSSGPPDESDTSVRNAPAVLAAAAPAPSTAVEGAPAPGADSAGVPRAEASTPMADPAADADTVPGTVPMDVEEGSGATTGGDEDQAMLPSGGPSGTPLAGQAQLQQQQQGDAEATAAMPAAAMGSTSALNAAGNAAPPLPGAAAAAAEGAPAVAIGEGGAGASAISTAVAAAAAAQRQGSSGSAGGAAGAAAEPPADAAADGADDAAAAAIPPGPAPQPAPAPAPAPGQQSAAQQSSMPPPAYIPSQHSQQQLQPQGAASGSVGVVGGGYSSLDYLCNQRNISDVVTNATASGVSARAGIKWPGIPVGSGIKPRARSALPTPSDRATSPARGFEPSGAAAGAGAGAGAGGGKGKGSKAGGGGSVPGRIGIVKLGKRKPPSALSLGQDAPAASFPDGSLLGGSHQHAAYARSTAASSGAVLMALGGMVSGGNTPLGMSPNPSMDLQPAGSSGALDGGGGNGASEADSLAGVDRTWQGDGEGGGTSALRQPGGKRVRLATPLTGGGGDGGGGGAVAVTPAPAAVNGGAGGGSTAGMLPPDLPATAPPPPAAAAAAATPAAAVPGSMGLQQQPVLDLNTPAPMSALPQAPAPLARAGGSTTTTPGGDGANGAAVAATGTEQGLAATATPAPAPAVPGAGDAPMGTAAGATTTGASQAVEGGGGSSAAAAPAVTKPAAAMVLDLSRSPPAPNTAPAP